MNYVATSAFILGLVALRSMPRFVCGRPRLCAVFAFVTGMMHESASIGVAIGAIVCLCLNLRSVSIRDVYRSLSSSDRILSKAFVAGMAVAVLSPGIWMRFFKVQAGMRHFYDGTVLSLLLSTLPLLFLFVAVVLVMASFAKCRVMLRMLLADRMFVFWSVAALAASVAVFAGRLEGNSGWFAELFSLCALGRLAVLCCPAKCSRLVVCAAVIVSVAFVAHSFYVAAAQKRYFEAVECIRTMYAAIDDEVVFHDAPEVFTDNLLLLDRIHDVNNRDIYTSTVLASFYGRENMLVLPEAYRGVDLDSMLFRSAAGLFKVNDEIILAAAVPSSAEPVIYWSGTRGWNYADGAGRHYTVMPFLYGGSEYSAFIAD